MPNQQPVIVDATGRRAFACSAVAVLAFIVDADERILLLAHPGRKGGWEVVNGALEATETVLDGVLREIREEVGADVRVRPLGTVHAYTFYYDEHVQYLLSLCYLLAYEGGRVQPGDDMRGSQFRWWSLGEQADAQVRLIVPRDRKWLAVRALVAPINLVNRGLRSATPAPRRKGPTYPPAGRSARLWRCRKAGARRKAPAKRRYQSICALMLVRALPVGWPPTPPAAAGASRTRPVRHVASP